MAKKRIETTVRLPEHIHRAAKVCADNVGQSLNAFCVMAVAQRVRNWRDPVTRRRITEQDVKRAHLDGWVCYHGVHAHPVPATVCEYSTSAAHRAAWQHAELPETLFDTWALEEGHELPYELGEDEDLG